MNRQPSIDGSVFTTSEYLKAIDGGKNSKFYRMYELQLSYLTNLFKIKGNKDIERISSDIIRQYFEFGRVGVMKLKGRYIPLAITTVEKNIYREIKMVEALPMREGMAYSKDHRTFKLKGSDVSVASPNFNSLPFIFFWETAIREILSLESAAQTASIASIKKFKRVRRNNSSSMSALETKAMMNPDTPYIDEIQNIDSYIDEDTQRTSGNQSKHDLDKSSRPSSITFESNNGGSSGVIWDNLKEKIAYEYYLLGREVNTNKKNERNIEGEVQSEKENFDIIRDGWHTGLKMLVERLNEIYGDNLTVEMTLENIRSENEQDTDKI